MKSDTLVPMTVYTCLTLLLLGFTGCSDNSDRIVKRAPQNSSELGFLVSGATEEQKNTFFNENTSVKIREISNDEIILFEVLNSDLKTLRENFPESRVFKNEFINMHGVEDKSLSMDQIKSMRFHNSQQNSDFDLSSCEDKSLKPIAKMNLLSLNLKSDEPLEAGEDIFISGASSEPHAFIGGALKTAWIVNGPLGTNVPKTHLTDELSINLDTMGVYQIYLVVQDKKLNCQYESLSLSVTGNTPFLGVSLDNLDNRISNQPYIQKLGLQEAHLESKGDGTLIAIVDSGVNYNNPYLAPNIFINKKEIPNNNFDDDNNGLIDDVYGWDFVYDDAQAYDDLGHGSHLAGLAAAKVFGVAPNAQILPIKVGSNNGRIDLGTTFKGVIYALKMEADIINMSLGSERQIFREELELYRLALNRDALIVVSAGNGEPSRLGLNLGIDIDRRSFAPAGIDLENILTVASVSNNNSLAYYSNYGLNKVNLATYGGEDFDLTSRQAYDGQLYSTYIENAKGLLFFSSQGTSMATPVASGVAALVRGLNPNLTAGQTARVLENSGPRSQEMSGRIKSGRILTAKQAIEFTKRTMSLLN